MKFKSILAIAALAMAMFVVGCGDKAADDATKGTDAKADAGKMSADADKVKADAGKMSEDADKVKAEAGKMGDAKAPEAGKMGDAKGAAPAAGAGK